MAHAPAKENRSLTEVGKGKPMGEFMRRYWLPAAKSEEVPTAGGAPARVKLLGEQLVLFRSRDGELGLIEGGRPDDSYAQRAAGAPS